MVSEIISETTFVSQSSVTMLSQLFFIAKATCVPLQALKRYIIYLVRNIHQDISISRNRKSCHVSYTVKTHKATNSRIQKVRVQSISTAMFLRGSADEMFCFISSTALRYCIQPVSTVYAQGEVFDGCDKRGSDFLFHFGAGV